MCAAETTSPETDFYKTGFWDGNKGRAIDSLETEDEFLDWFL